MENFTIQDALNIQLENICQWSKVLNADTYLRLLQDINKRNQEGYNHPRQVIRGEDICIMIANYMNEC